jgi:tetratricopeptide (TPR) repeat protein
MLRIIHIFLVIMLLSACSHSVVEPIKSIDIPLNQSLFTLNDILISEKDIFSLSKEQENDFFKEYEKLKNEGLEPHVALAEYLQRFKNNFTFYGETNVAQTSLDKKQGNCLSLSILTTALTRLVGLKTSYREVTSAPIFQKNNQFISSSSHVQTIIYDPNFVPVKGMIYLTKPGIVIDYFPVKNSKKGPEFSFNKFLSMYYRNIAGDALINKKPNLAFVYGKEALRILPSSVEAINFMALLHKTENDIITAEKLYKLGMFLDEKNIPIIRNYMILLAQNSRHQEVEFYQEILNDLDNPNPYIWLEQAYKSHKDNDQAEIYFKKALKNAPYLKEAYIGLAKIYFKRSNKKLTKKMLENALKWSYKKEEQQLYKMKLSTLSAT